MIAVIVPVHNEAETLEGCLDALHLAARDPALAGEPVYIIAVLDACTDDSEQIARRAGVICVQVEERNVGKTREAGAQLALRLGARWLCFTDADSVVADSWIAQQLSLNADAVCGTVTIEEWGDLSNGTRRTYQLAYRDEEGHPHIHGANLGVRAEAYRAAGGMPPLSCGEDVALVGALQAMGARVVFSARPRVVTSGRLHGRLRGGFACFLRSLSEQEPRWSSKRRRPLA